LKLKSNPVAEKISAIRGITCVSLVMGNIDIMSTCLFRETADLFKIIERSKQCVMGRGSAGYAFKRDYNVKLSNSRVY
jgi:hypothetical protein